MLVHVRFVQEQDNSIIFNGFICFKWHLSAANRAVEPMLVDRELLTSKDHGTLGFPAALHS